MCLLADAEEREVPIDRHNLDSVRNKILIIPYTVPGNLCNFVIRIFIVIVRIRD